jgi:gluconate 5-dehydrogenase
LEEPLQLFSLGGRVALVTGASRGIGRAIAEGLASAGATVVGASRSPAPAGDSRIEHRAADVTVESAVNALVDELVRAHGRLDILVNAAGQSLPSGTAAAARSSTSPASTRCAASPAIPGTSPRKGRSPR